MCQSDRLEWWKQSPDTPHLFQEIPAKVVPAFFRKKKTREELSPQWVYRAKTEGRFKSEYQLDFIDVGLMPIVEADMGHKLGDLIERVVHRLRESLWPDPESMSNASGQWLLQASFWLLAGKILRDKQVRSFKRLDLANATAVFDRVARHYGAQNLQTTKRQEGALGLVVDMVADFSNVSHISTEALAHIYENTLVSKETRKKLGTHSTPSYLVDYMVWQLSPWISAMQPENRRVFEPACGHAAFLVSAMRMLREMPSDNMPANRREYLRRNLAGCESDSFALEVARLSLTLADIPNPNGWQLTPGDMFASDILAREARRANILLANPPFENFKKEEERRYSRKGLSLIYRNKAAEMLGRVLPDLPAGAVFGVVIPQSILHGKNATSLRKLMVENFELQQICLFPDGVFTFADSESAIVLGRKAKPKPGHRTNYSRVEESDLRAFKTSYVVSAEKRVLSSRFSIETQWNMRIPRLEQTWECLSLKPKLGQIVMPIGRGLSYERDSGLPTWSQDRFEGAVQGFVKFEKDTPLHRPPPKRWMNLDQAVVKIRRYGTDIGTPQVILNAVRAGRGPWRLRAYIDTQGCPFTNNFNVLRPKSTSVPLQFIWALLNSPVGNAYSFSYATGRHCLGRTLEDMPIPEYTDENVRLVSTKAKEYINTVSRHGEASTPARRAKAKELLLHLDAEILRLYDLPPLHERKLLDMFSTQQRVGVPFEFTEYFPPGFQPCIPLHEYLSTRYRESTAGELRKKHPGKCPPALLAAMRRADEDFGDDK